LVAVAVPAADPDQSDPAAGQFVVIQERIAVARQEFGKCFEEELNRVGNEALQSARSNQRKAAALAIVPIVSVAIVWLAINFTVTRRIETLSDCAQQIAGGDFGARVDVNSNDELGLLGASFNRMARTLTTRLDAEWALRNRLLNAERFALLGEFAASVAHGLGNPLASIRAAAELGASQAEDPSPYQEILDLAQRLERHIAQILEASRPAQDASGLVDVDQLVGEAWSALEPHARSMGISGILDLGGEAAQVEANKLSLERAFLSVMENAVEASPPDGEIRIATRVDDEILIVTVEDEGPGISDEDRERVFAQFFTTKERGTGLGLSIVKRTVAGLGGTIDLLSRNEGGTVAEIRIPM
jgi:signal transduction histidine kinase